MLIGSTFAWFTDSASTGVNIIKSGKLEIGFEYAEGTEEPATANWNNAENAKIFDYVKWEPGYTVAKHIKISNKGDLALKYQVSFKLDGTVGKLAEVIDVYYIDPAAAVSTRNDVENLVSIGTLDTFLTGGAVFGDLGAGKANTVTIILKMQEQANNDYQDKSVGEGLTIVLNATQDTVETDSFNNQYDKEARLPDEKIVVTDNASLTEAIEAKTEYVVNSGEYSKIIRADGVNVIVNDADFKTESMTQIALVKNGGTLTILNATTPSFAGSGSYLSMIANVTTNGTIIIKDGSYTAGQIFMGDSTGKAIIEGGTFDGMFLNSMMPPYQVGSIEIKGGKFSNVYSYELSQYVNLDTHTITQDGSWYIVAEK